MSIKSPAFQFYPNDFLGSGKVLRMSTEEVGCYLLLLLYDWNETGFAYDVKDLAQVTRLTTRKFEAAWKRVGPCFVERDGRWFNPRLELERTRQAEWREKSSKGGKASAQAKANQQVNQTSTTVQPPTQPTGQPKGNTQSSSSSQVTTTAKQQDQKHTAHPASPVFVIAWQQYPKRSGSNPRRSAERAWHARVAEGVHEADLLAGVERYRSYCEANRSIGSSYVMQAQRFFGPNREFEDAWTSPPATPVDPLEQRAAAIVDEDRAREAADARWIEERRMASA
jgi:uncharacterized protein YdaU (DUF1376 family)